MGGLVALLALSWGLLAVGQPETAAHPAADSMSPSGTQIFAELLRRQGYKVVIDRRARPQFGKSDIAVVFLSGLDVFDPLADEPKDLEASDEELGATSMGSTLKPVREFVNGGGSAVLLPFDENFMQASRAASRASSIKLTFNENLKAAAQVHGPLPPTDPLSSNPRAVPIWKEGATNFVSAEVLGKGTVFYVRDGIVATNRFIDQGDNWRVLEGTIRAANPGAKTIRFAELGFGNVRDPGLMATIGNWAQVAWWQFLFTCGVIVYTLGKRFGLPDPPRAPQRESRELIEAVSTVLRRRKHAAEALATLVDIQRSRLVNALRLSSDASPAEVYRQLPDDLAGLMRKAEDESRDRTLNSKRAFELGSELEARVSRLIEGEPLQ